MSTEQKEYLQKMYADTLQASRFNTFKILNTLIIALFILLFLNVLFTTPDDTISYISLIVAVVSVMFMFYRLTREKAGMRALPDDVSNVDGDIIREHIDMIRNNQRKLRWQMALFTIPFFIYFLIDLFVSATEEVDKKYLVIKIAFFFVLLILYYFLFFRIRKANFTKDENPQGSIGH